MRTAYWAINQDKKETYMSKNLTRKSLAFGAFVALASTLIAGAPASANGVDDGSVTIAPTTGTSYNALLTTDFKLNVNYVSGIAINGAKLSAIVEDSTAQVRASFSQADVAVAVQTFTAGSVVVESASTADSAGASTADVLRLSLPSTVTATTAVGVTVWYDSNGNKVIDTNEKRAPKQTVTFYRASDITWTAALVAPAIGATTLTGTVTPSITLNGQQIGNDTVVYADFGSTNSSDTSINTSETSTYNSTNRNWDLVSGTINAAAAGVVYSARPYVIDAQIGTRVFQSIATVTTATSSKEIVTNANVTVNASNTANADVRAGTREITIKITATKADSKPVAAGVPVLFNWNTATITGYNATTAPITINGIARATGVNLTVPTDASGVATAVISVPSTVVAGNVLTITTPTIEGVANTNTATVVTWVAPDFAVFDSGVAGNTATVAGHYSNVAGTTRVFNLRVVDQFKQPLTATDHVIKTVLTGRASSTFYTPVVAGVANVSVADGAIAGQDATIAKFTLEKATGSSYTASTASTTPKSTVNLNMLDTDGVQINYIAAGQSFRVTLGGTRASVAEDLAGTVSEDAAVAANTELSNVLAPVSGATAAIVGVVSNSTTGALNAGAEVTLTGANLLFNVGNQFGLGSITIRANASGEFAVNVFANRVTTGTVVTVTSGGGSATKTVVFTSSLGARSLVVTAPAFATAGTAVDVVATLADKWGNGVSADSLTLSSTGPGYLNSTGSTTTVTSGTVRAKLIFGASETGAAVITATVATSSAALAAADKTKTATVTIGTAPSATPAGAVARIAGSTNRFFVSVDGNTLARNVVVRVAGRSFATLKGSATNRSYAVRAPKGSHKVTVFVGGKLIGTKTITVR